MTPCLLATRSVRVSEHSVDDGRSILVHIPIIRIEYVPTGMTAVTVIDFVIVPGSSRSHSRQARWRLLDLT